jgi:hypothetical protein
MSMQGLTKIHHLGVPYAFSILLPWKGRWHTVDFIAHKPRWRNDTSSAMPTEGIPVSMPGYDWDTIYHLEASFKKCWIKDFSDTPCVLYRGGWNETLKFYSIHYKLEVLFAPRISENTSDTHRHITWREPPVILPLTYTSLRILPNPG